MRSRSHTIPLTTTPAAPSGATTKTARVLELKELHQQEQLANVVETREAHANILPAEHDVVDVDVHAARVQCTGDARVNSLNENNIAPLEAIV